MVAVVAFGGALVGLVGGFDGLGCGVVVEGGHGGGLRVAGWVGCGIGIVVGK